MEILEHQTLEMRNVLSYRAKMSEQELATKMPEIERIIKKAGAKRCLPTVTTSYGISQSPAGSIPDLEILVPLDRKIPVPDGFDWKERFFLTNAVMVQHIGNPGNVGESVKTLNNFIIEKKLTPISTVYNATVVEAKSPLEMDNLRVNIYVSISPNIL